VTKEIEIKLPKLGESIVNAMIVQWFKKEGDLVHLDEPLLEVSTDKVNREISSPVAGKITKILAQAGEELNVGEILAKVEEVHKVEQLSSSKNKFLTPAVLKIAQKKNLSPAEMKEIPATGSGGRLSKRDLENFLAKKSKTLDTTTPITISSIRKVIADNMVRSWREIPHVTLVSEVDLSKIVRLISEKKNSFKKTQGCKLTITSFIAHAIGKTVEEFPLVNSSFEEKTIMTKKAVNLGFAVNNIERGLLVPILYNCHTLSLTDIARKIAELSDKVRSGTLDPDQLQGGTITMTNFGMSGVLLGTPMIRHKEVAIIGVGAINKKIIVLEDDTMAIRSMIYLTLTFDHRVFDGMYGCGYLAAIKRYLESYTEQSF